ncbi:MAG TPA: ABC transporter permease [Candidatus Baltobacteraceae bacterium]|nr:ABC transporter permease [Candidatus Baltobacteraceae bacterium]
MLTYIFRRLMQLVIVLAVVGVIAFLLIHLAPGDPASVMLGSNATQDQVDRLRQQLALDQPLPVQFVAWSSRVLQGDLGISHFAQKPVLQVLAQRAEPTLILTSMSILVAILIGVPTGVVAAIRRGGGLDQAALGLALLGASVPSFWLGLSLILFFAVRLGWFPSSGILPLASGGFESLRYYVLPALALGFPNSALITRITRSSMLDVLNQDYVRTAESKGVSPFRVIIRHALRNALVPIVTIIGLTIASLMGGAVVTETVFSIPGVGRLVVQSVLRRDYPVIQAAILLVATIYVLVNLAVDLLYVWVDPRIRVVEQREARPA